jgi:iron complex outermembrane receptor protein
MYGFQARLLAGAALTATAALALSPAARAQAAVAATGAVGASAATSAADVVDEVVVTGVRGRPKTVANSPVPIDIVSAAQLTATGKAGLKQILSAAIPSLTLPAQNGGGTSASVPPYAVEGLTGDYVLVLVNGKRRHSTSLINNLATIGGGSTPVDLDLIPPSAIDHIEYLRDGAAAQYGSDAIAGVINIILKDGAGGGAFETTAGQTYKSTGRLLQENADWGTSFFGGSIHFALSALHNEPARANTSSSGVLYPLVNGQLDPREASANTNYGSAYGRSTLDNQIDLSYDLTAPVGHGLDFYSYSTVSYRDIKDARGAFRPDDLSSLPQIYPNGFQAYRRIHETDFQFAGGLKGQLAGWQWDLSSTFGRDFAWLGASNTLNASLGPSVDQTSFYLGEQIFDQWVNNLDVTRSFNIGLAKPLDVSWGLEHRWEQFAEVAGEPNSYINGGYQIPNDGTPFGNLYHGKYPQAGLQSFTGASPADASTHSRNNFAAYADLGTNITSAWYLGVAGRAEHYDDSSGNSLSGKVTTRYEILPGLALRGSVNNGFHAPSLAEEWFSTTQNTTVVVNGQGVSAQSKFLPVGNAIAKALGATPLTPETSLNYSIGLTYEPIHRLRLTIDAYQIDIANRIVKSAPNFSLSAAQVAALGFPGLSSVQFFTNGVNTRTQGVDAVAEYQQSLGALGTVRWSAIYSGNGTSITRVKASAANFSALAARQLVEQTPRYRLALGGDWDVGKWKVHLLQTLYGRYEEPVNNSLDAVFHPKWVTDLDVAYQVRRNVTVAVGANNLLNVYPSRVPAAVLAKTAAVDSVLVGAPGYSLAAYGLPESGGGIYGADSPYGLEGGFYYVRLGVKF